MTFFGFDRELAELRERGLLRVARVAPPDLVDLSSNDYFGLAQRPLEPSEGGARASMLVSGFRQVHEVAEAALRSWLGVEAGLIFSSGYAANVGTLQALAGPEDVIVSDRLNHASIVDGCRLSGAEVRVVSHLDTDAVKQALQESKARRRIVATESYFSMDADMPDLKALREICTRYDAILFVDESHALGTFGPRGEGLCKAAGVVPDVIVGAFGKALGLQGAFVGGSAILRQWLWNRARSFGFSTALSPALAAAIPSRVDALCGAGEQRAHLTRLAERIRALLTPQFSVLGSGPIVPVVLGDGELAMRASAFLEEQGFLVPAIRPPSVPVGSARLRITLSAQLEQSVLENFAEQLMSFA